MNSRSALIVARLVEDDLSDLSADDLIGVAAGELEARREALKRSGIVNAETADLVDRWYHRKSRKKDGSPMEARRNGRTKRWKRRPDEFKIPVKYGLYDYFYIQNSNAHEWSTVPNPEPEQ